MGANQEYRGPTARAVGHKKYDELLEKLMQAVRDNISREDLVHLFIDRMSILTTAKAIVVLEVQHVEEESGKVKRTVCGVHQWGIHPNRWSRFCDVEGVLIADGSLIHKVIEDGIEMDVWGSMYIDSSFEVFHPLFDVRLGGWISGIQLKRATAQHSNQGIFLWYLTGKHSEGPPPGAEIDWRTLSLFQYCFELAGYSIRKVARQIIMQRQELLRMLTPSILNHEINARISFFREGLEYISDDLGVFLRRKGAVRLSPASHETLNAILNKINSQLLPQAELLTKVSESVMGLTRRIASGPTDPIVEIQRAIDLLTHKAGKASVLIEPLSHKEGIIEVITDPALLMHVIVNLIKNAIEALEPVPLKSLEDKKRIWIEVKWLENQDDSYPLCIYVCDNGPGVPPEFENRIFEAGITTKKGGHGLGLAICKMIASYLGGSLELSSLSNPTIFNLQLPKESPKIADLEEELKQEAEKP